MDRPGMYVLGLPFTRRRKSSFLDGVGADATELSNAPAQIISVQPHQATCKGATPASGLRPTRGPATAVVPP